MNEIKFDDRYYRVHNDKNKRLIRKSLVECGAGRSIVLDKDDVIIAGNGVYEMCIRDRERDRPLMTWQLGLENRGCISGDG